MASKTIDNTFRHLVKARLGIEAIKGMKGYEGGSHLVRLMSRMLKKSDPAAFFFLSIKWYNPGQIYFPLP